MGARGRGRERCAPDWVPAYAGMTGHGGYNCGVDYPFRAIVFDFDGLIVDTEQPIYDAYRVVFQGLGVPLTLDTWAGVIGGTGHRDALFDYLEAQLGRGVERDAVRRQAREQSRRVTDVAPAQPGAPELIAEAKEAGLALAVASSSSRAWVNGHLDRLGLLSAFDALCARDDVEREKPYPDLYLLALLRLEVEARDAFAIEDSPNGVTAAQAAGLRCVVVPNALTAEMPLAHADLRLPSLAGVSLAEIASALEER